MNTLRMTGLILVFLGAAAGTALAMPINPILAEKAGGYLSLSEGVLAAPPPYVDVPLPIPAAGHSGNYKVLLIAIKFSNLPNTYSKASFDSMAFLGWPTGTINQYYTEISYGNLTLSGQALGWYTASQTRDYYGNGAKGWGSYPQNTARLVEEAVDAAETAGCNFAQYDNDGDGTAESIYIVHSGEGCETSLNANDIQSHVSSISGMGGTARTYDGVTIDTYACCPELQTTTPAAHINIGVYCHEYGHILGLPDLYDIGFWCTGRTGWGIGAWGLMCYGGWGGNVVTPSSPAHMCSWSKIQLGWLTPFVVGQSTPGAQLYPFENYAQVFKVGMNTRETEYFLIEYRDSVGFDRSLVRRGTLIYHVDDLVSTGNDCEDGGACTSGGFHYRVALEQPDGNYNLDCGAVGNYADRGDAYYYRGVASFSGTTTPKSNTYDGKPSGVSVGSIRWGIGGTHMTMDITPGALYPEIAYDDGGRDICYSWGTANSGFAVRITPAKYPAFVRGLVIMGCDPYGPNFQCQVWDASGTGGAPGSPLSSVHTTPAAVPYSWTYEDFTADSVVINSGDFWAVYIEYNNSDLASDNSSPWSGRTRMYYMGSFYADNGAYGNYMIRAVVDTLYCAGVGPVVPLALEAWVGPNPFRDTAAITFLLNSAASVSLAIYDVRGRLVRDLGTSRFDAGRRSVVWDGRDLSGAPVGAGVYFYRLTSGGIARTGKVSLLR